MNPNFLRFASVLLCLGAACGPGYAQSEPPAAFSLAGWTLLRADSATRTTAASFHLPAGGELVRRDTAEAIVLSLSSKPHFSLEPENWPVVQVGRAALVFTRQGERARVYAAMDDKIREIPLAIELDASGRAREAVQIAIGLEVRAGFAVFATEAGTVTVDGASGGLPVELSLSAGEAQAWDLLALKVAGLTASAGRTAPRQTGATEPAGHQVAAARAVSTLHARQAMVTSSEAGLRPTRQEAIAESASRPPISLEIFTPPAARHTRTAELRAAAARLQR